MKDIDKLYDTSVKYVQFVDEIHDELDRQHFEERKMNSVKACKHGLKFWKSLLKLMKMVEANSVYELSENNPTIIDLLSWASDFPEVLDQACIEDKRFEVEKLEFCKEYIKMHENMLDKEVANLGNVRTSLAQTYFYMGRDEKADLLFKKWLDIESDWGWGWIAWSDCYWLRFGRACKIEKDFNKAKKILLQGLSIRNVRDKEYLKERLLDLQEEEQKTKKE